MAEYNPSKIIKDGNTYNFRDTTKIPLAGSNQISGDLIPSTDGTVNLGSVSYQWNNAYIKSLTINGVVCGDILTHNASEFVPRSGGSVMMGTNLSRTVNNSQFDLHGGNGWGNGASIGMHGKDAGGALRMYANDGTHLAGIDLRPSGAVTFFNNGTTKNLAMQEDVIPRSGGAVMTGSLLASPTTTTSEIGFGYGWGSGGTIYTYSPTNRTVEWQGTIRLEPLKTTSSFKTMQLAPDGTWTWNGTACQITSDQRYKQQITKIDDKLLDAWEDVELSQFKYNDAVNEKGNNARLHTGYVVQQIYEACKSHGVDISAYGLYCHEEYPEETKEVEIEQADGTKTKKTKVIREANEHYSLRYTEALIVECKYLRRCISRLTARIEELEKGNNTK